MAGGNEKVHGRRKASAEQSASVGPVWVEQGPEEDRKPRRGSGSVKG